jgi:hypothetical protein
MANYDKGDLVRCSAAFTNSAGTAIDPTAVLFKVKDPSGNITSYTYVTDAELVKDSTGNYHVDVDADEVGKWYYRFYSTGTGQAAGDSDFTILETQF